MIDGDEIHITWSVHDVLYVCPHLTKEQAREVLHDAYRKHEKWVGITWETFRIFASMMFPKTMA